MDLVGIYAVKLRIRAADLTDRAIKRIATLRTRGRRTTAHSIRRRALVPGKAA